MRGRGEGGESDLPLWPLTGIKGENPNSHNVYVS